MNRATASLNAFHLGEKIRKAQDAGDREAEKAARAEWEQYKRGFADGPSTPVIEAFNRGYHLP